MGHTQFEYSFRALAEARRRREAEENARVLVEQKRRALEFFGHRDAKFDEQIDGEVVR